MKVGPPRLFHRFFRWFCHPAIVRYVEGDLLELYYERVRRKGPFIANVRFAVDVIMLFRPSIIRPAEGYTRLNHYGMLKNYLTVSWRNLMRFKLFSFINVFGLALGMSLCLLLILMIGDQNRYEQFNTKKDRIYRVITNAPGGKQPYATTPFPLGNFLASNYPTIEKTVTLLPGVGGDVASTDRTREMRGYLTGPSFFEVFDFQLELGNAQAALVAPRSIVITKELANYLFAAENPIGKVVQFSDRKLSFPIRTDGNDQAPVSWGAFTVTGVIDQAKYKSHLQFDVLMSAATLPILRSSQLVDDLENNWEWYFKTYTFALLKPDKTIDDLSFALTDAVTRNESAIRADYAKGLTFGIQPLSEIQLGLIGNDTNNRLPIQGYWFLGFLAVIIIVSAVVNYTNLSIARALTRAKEIGIRKVTGAARRSLIFQFLCESIVVSLLALFFATGILLMIRPAFKGLWVNRYLNFELPLEPSVMGWFVFFAIGIGVVAGLFPAWRMSGYQPIAALKKVESTGSSRGRMRKALSVVQFAFSLLFITTSILVFNQFKHYMSFDYGIATENVVNVDLQGVDYQKLATAFQGVAGVVSVSASDLIPAAGRTNGIEVKLTPTSEPVKGWVIHASENFVENLGLTLVAGSTVQPSQDSLTTRILVNEALIRQLGIDNPASAVGVALEGGQNHTWVIHGVVKDFRHQLPINTNDIGPLVIFNRPSQFKFLNVRVAANGGAPLIAELQEKWKLVDPTHVMKYEYYDRELASTHEAISDLVTILGTIAFMAVVIACLGLLGMATYMTERRRKEVGIRKAMGAANWGIALLLSKGFIQMMVVAIVIGAPMSYFLNNFWLQYLPNRVEFGPTTVLIAVVLLIIPGFITVSSQTYHASKTKPVDILREE